MSKKIYDGGKDTIDFAKMKIVHRSYTEDEYFKKTGLSTKSLEPIITEIHFKDPILIKLPMMRCTFGIQKNYNYKTDDSKYECCLSFDSGSSEIDNFQKNMKCFDEFLIKTGVENSSTWFNKKYDQPIIECFHYSIIKGDDNERSDNSPFIRCIIPYNNAKKHFSCECFNENNLIINPHKFQNLIMAGSCVEAVIKIQNIWCVHRRFGITPQLVQIRKCPNIIDATKLDGSKQLSFEKIFVKEPLSDGYSNIYNVNDMIFDTIVYIETSIVHKQGKSNCYRIDNKKNSEIFFDNLQKIRKRLEELACMKNVEFINNQKMIDYNKKRYVFNNYNDLDTIQIDSFNHTQYNDTIKNRLIVIPFIYFISKHYVYGKTKKYCSLALRIKRIINLNEDDLNK
jgi:hypothetical protein